MRLLALGGSLREASRNRALLHEAAALAPAGTKLDLSHVAVVGSLPLFSQDMLERDGSAWGCRPQECTAGGGRPAACDARVQLGGFRGS